MGIADLMNTWLITINYFDGVDLLEIVSVNRQVRVVADDIEHAIEQAKQMLGECESIIEVEIDYDADVN